MTIDSQVLKRNESNFQLDTIEMLKSVEQD